MARLPKDYPIDSVIYGIDGSRRYQRYEDLNEVLNMIGVMAKRKEVPYATPLIPPSRVKRYIYYNITYYVPKNWRECLYEDLETGQYYIVSPDPINLIHNHIQSWIAFKITGLRDPIRRVYRDFNSDKLIKEIEHHSGSFIDLIARCGLNDALDTLARTEKPIKVTVRKWCCDSYDNTTGSICTFDI